MSLTHVYDISITIFIQCSILCPKCKSLDIFSCGRTNKQITSETSAKIFSFSQIKINLFLSLFLVHTHTHTHTQGCWLKLILILIFQVTEYWSIASCYFSLIKNFFLCSNIASVFSTHIFWI